jgi:hypothetical protein
MAGASDPGVAAALEAQSKAIDVQSRTMATQSKLLQQLCDRFEHQDQRWSSIEKVVDQNAANIANLQGRLNDEELTCVLGERMDGQMAEFQQDQAYRVQELMATTSTRVAVLENVSSVFEAWRPRIEGSIDSVRSSVDTMRSELARLTQLLEGGIAGEHHARPSLLGAYVPVAERPSTTAHNSDWAHGHRNACQPREYGIENSQIPIHLPNNGMHSPYIPQTHDTRPNRTSWDNHPYTSDAMGGSVQDPNFARNLGNLPKLHFPSFDGGNPKLWQTRCEDYFLMYSVDPRMWIKVASTQRGLSVGEYCRQMKGMVDSLHGLDEPVADRTLVLNLLRGLSPPLRPPEGSHQENCYLPHLPRRSQQASPRGAHHGD